MPLTKTTVTKLEMRTEPLLHVATPAVAKLMLLRAERPSLSFYRYLYDIIGRDFAWVDRKRLPDSELLNIIHDEMVEVWVLYVAGQPAGYFELDARALPGHVEIMYFGLIPEFRGRGLGKWLLSEAIRACWSKVPDRVIVETCTLDGPAALPLYQKLGFRPYDRLEKTVNTDLEVEN